MMSFNEEGCYCNISPYIDSEGSRKCTSFVHETVIFYIPFIQFLRKINLSPYFLTLIAFLVRACRRLCRCPVPEIDELLN